VPRQRSKARASSRCASSFATHGVPRPCARRANACVPLDAPAARVVASMRRSGLRAATHASPRASAMTTSSFCGGCEPGSGRVRRRAWCERMSFRASAAEGSPRTCAPSTSQSRSPVWSNARHVCPPERVRSLRARIHRLAWTVPGPRVLRAGRVRVSSGSACRRDDANVAPRWRRFLLSSRSQGQPLTLRALRGSLPARPPRPEDRR